MRILPLLVLVCSTVPIFAQGNLVPNGGFEARQSKDGFPEGGWWLYQGPGSTRVNVRNENPHGGEAAVSLESEGASRAVLVSPAFAVFPGDEIAFEAFVRQSLTEAGGQAVHHAGVAFRNAEGRVFQRSYLLTAAGGEWSRIAGTHIVPAGAAKAEVHLGCSNLVGSLFYDDVRAENVSPVSFGLKAGPGGWVGEHEIVTEIISRRNSFTGAVCLSAGPQRASLPVSVGVGQSREVRLPVKLRSTQPLKCALALVDSDTYVVRSIEATFRASPPLTLYPACPCFLLLGGDGKTLVDSRIDVAPEKRKGLTLRLEVFSEDGSRVFGRVIDVGTNAMAGAEFELSTARVGAFSVKAVLLDASGVEVSGSAASTEVRVRPAHESQVALGSDGYLCVQEKPFFPVGLYSSARYEEMAAGGFTSTHSYSVVTGESEFPVNLMDIQLKALLDRTWTNGMRMMVELPRKAIEQGNWEQIRRRVQTFRNHPGLLCWGSEERVARGEAPLKNLRKAYQLTKELDPRHPFVLGDSRDVIQKLQEDRRQFFPESAMDVGIWWWYPIPLRTGPLEALEGGSGGGAALEAPSWLTTAETRKPLWIAIQAYQKPAPDARYPTPAEYRAMAYLSIINGVKGLWFYTGSGQRDHLGRPAGLLNNPEESHWTYVRKLTSEIRQLEAIITAPPGPKSVKMEPADAPVQFTTRQAASGLCLIAASTSVSPYSVSFHGLLSEGQHAEILGENARPLRDLAGLSFGPLEVMVIRVTPAGK